MAKETCKGRRGTYLSSLDRRVCTSNGRDMDKTTCATNESSLDKQSISSNGTSVNQMGGCPNEAHMNIHGAELNETAWAITCTQPVSDYGRSQTNARSLDKD